MKRLVEIVVSDIADGHYQVFVIHANVPEKAEALRQLLIEEGVEGDIPLRPLVVLLGRT